ncbi:hypothetical protein PIB30_055526 [Stylosanthes scabra]|uniref:Uncharacterized protein n=1 Tax=Stylosanthes scabra TaxID=79078 RepID=A0ABU6QIY1_9FABA|nr:hypothetical protein [Stylosanthes scabra]
MACCFLASSSALFTASEANAASQGVVAVVSLGEWYFFHSLLGSPGPALLAPRSRKVPIDGVNVKIGSSTIVQRTSKGGQDTRFGTRRCPFGDKPYGVALSYCREGVDVKVNSSRSPEYDCGILDLIE